MHADLIESIEKVMSIEALLWAVLIGIALLSVKKLLSDKLPKGKKWIRIETVEDEDGNDEA
ncbi:MAG: hypothetical protein GXO90_03925 [FCB group bacterium]|nr:hypothetical protein [FCB group bacterium]